MSKLRIGIALGSALLLLTAATVYAQQTGTSSTPEAEATAESAQTDLEANKQLVARVVNVLNTGDYTVLDEIVREDFIQNGAGRPSTREGLRLTYAGYRAAFPDIQWTIEYAVAEGDYVFIYTTISGTHEGEFNGIPATGRSAQINTADLYRIEDGMIAEHWDAYDQLSLLQQLGVLPPLS